ncbi:hypothetical protein ACH5RR_034502 [Cinchona calisaya]|uniref:Uncharacterized protein n=1 Tax=Cinchona calisaya TaxID=153742 RepID=A0ABD2YCF3_9GENT
MKKNKVEKLKLLISILSQYVKYFSECQIEDKRFKKWFKDVDDVVRTANQAWDWESSSPKPCIQLVVSNLDNLGSIKDKIFELDSYFLDFMPKIAEHLLSFIDSLLQNLKVVFNYIDNSIVLMMAEVLEDVEERLMLLRNLLFLIPLNGLIEKQDSSVRMVVVCIQGLSLSVSRMLYILCTDDDETDIIDFRDKYPVLVGAFDTIVKEEVNDICEDYRKLFIATIADDDDANMDDQVLAIADYLIHKLRLLSDNEAPYSVVAPKDQIDILVDELSFLRCNLMDLLLRNPIKEMKSLVISTQVVIFRIGLFVYLSLVAKEDDTIADYYSLRLYDLLKVVDNVKKQASDILKEFFFSRSWQSNCPVPMCWNMRISSSTNWMNCRVLRGQIHIEYLLTRYKDAAYQAEFVIDSFLAGEGSTWCHELDIFVVTKDIKILHKEVKSLVRMTMSCDSYQLLRVLDLGIIGFSSSADTSDLVDIAKLVQLSSSATDSIKQILEEQRDMSNNQLNVNIVGMVESGGRADSGSALSVHG